MPSFSRSSTVAAFSITSWSWIDRERSWLVSRASPSLSSPPDPTSACASVRTPCRSIRSSTANVRALMNELGWVGFTSLQMLLSPDGEANVIDFNARFTNAIDQYIAAGPNFPDLWARVVTGRSLPPIPPVRTGVRFQWLEGDLRRALVQRRGGLLRDVIDCLSYARGAVHTTWRREDPCAGCTLGDAPRSRGLGEDRDDHRAVGARSPQRDQAEEAERVAPTASPIVTDSASGELRRWCRVG